MDLLCLACSCSFLGCIHHFVPDKGKSEMHYNFLFFVNGNYHLVYKSSKLWLFILHSVMYRSAQQPEPNFYRRADYSESTGPFILRQSVYGLHGSQY